MSTPDLASVAGLFGRVLPTSYWLRLGARSGFRRRGIFGLATVIWMMITQRLEGPGTLASALAALRAGGGRGLLRRCKRVREGRISAATGGYCQARQKLSKLTVIQIMDDIFQRLQAVLGEGQSGAESPVFLLDGSTILLDHEPDLLEQYPPASNQHGGSHWATLRLVVAHNVNSGLAVRPAWGPANGPKATSEQKLLEEVQQRLPPGAIELGDRNFGVFSVAWSAQQHQHGVLLRLNAAIARKLLGTLEAGVDREVVWRPSAYELRQHPEIPAEASVRGRVIVVTIPGMRDPLLCLFTTLGKAVSEVVRIYGLRWNVETDLRSLKRTVRLHHIHAQSVAMMEKELLLAIVAYNLVRAVMALAARKAGLSPRELSFTSIYVLLQAHWPRLLRAASDQAWQREMDRIVDYAVAYKLPKRKKQRTYPREVWSDGYRFPARKQEKTK